MSAPGLGNKTVICRRADAIELHCEFLAHVGPAPTTAPKRLAFQPEAPNMHLPPVELARENMVTLQEIAAMKIDDPDGVVLAGKFLLCRSIAPRFNLGYVAQILLDDPEGEFAISLRLVNYGVQLPPGSGFPSYSVNDDVPIGSVIALMNPWIVKYGSDDDEEDEPGPLSLHCQNPAHFIVLGAEHPLVQMVRWNEPEMPYPSEVEISELEITDTGVEYFIGHNYTMAIECFNQAINSNFGDVCQAYANRSAAHLAMGRPENALEDAERALACNSGQPVKNHTFLLRKAKALFYMKRFKECANFIEKNPLERTTSLPEYGTLLLTAKTCLLESEKGSFDITKLHAESAKNPYLEKHTDYLASDFVEFGQSGRGLFAKKNIEAGTLIMATRAFAYCHFPTPIKSEEVFDGDMTPHGSFDLYALVCAKRSVNPALTERELARITQSGLARVDDNPVEFLSDNAFLSHDRHGNVNGVGIWILPSLIGHSCVDTNCARSFIGDMMFIRTTRPISQGKCLLISFVPPSANYRERTQLLQSRDLECDCRLCTIEKADSSQDRVLFDTLYEAYYEKMQVLESKNAACSIDAEIVILKQALKDALDLRPDGEQVLNMAAHKLKQLLGRLYAAKANNEELDKASAMMSEVIGAFEELALLPEVLRCAEWLELWNSRELEVATRWSVKKVETARLIYGTEDLQAALV